MLLRGVELLVIYMSSVLILVTPIARACCFPSAIIETTVFVSHGVILPPGDVRPGAIMFAPLSTNLIAPLSTCCIGKMNGSF